MFCAQRIPMHKKIGMKARFMAAANLRIQNWTQHFKLGRERVENNWKADCITW